MVLAPWWVGKVANPGPATTGRRPLIAPRAWLNDGSCIRLRPERSDHAWVFDFVEDRTHDGRKFRMLNVVDEYTHECLSIRVSRKLKATDVIDVLSELFIKRGVPEHIRSDNGPEFVAAAVQKWIKTVGAKTAYIMPGSSWENGYVEGLNARLRDELLNGDIFYSLREEQVVVESWRRHYNAVRPHASLGDRPPAPEVVVPTLPAWPAALTRPAPSAKPPPWRLGRRCTKVHTGPPDGGRSDSRLGGM